MLLFFFLINHLLIFSNSLFLVANNQTGFADLLRNNTRNIILNGNMNLNPQTWRENQSRITLNPNITIVVIGNNISGNPPLIDLTDLTALKSLANYAFPSGTIDLFNGTKLKMENIKYTSDVGINVYSDLHNYFGIFHLLNNTWEIDLINSVMIVSPNSNFDTFLFDISGIIYITSKSKYLNSNAISISMNITTSTWIFRLINMTITRSQNYVISDGSDFIRNLEQSQDVKWIFLANWIHFPNNMTATIQPNRTIYIYSTSNQVLDIDMQVGKILLEQGSVLRFSGIQVVNSVPIPSYFNEEGTLSVINMTSLDPNSLYYGGSVIMENSWVYGRHNSPLYANYYQISAPECSASYIPTISTVDARDTIIRKWQINRANYELCVNNILTQTPSYRRFVNITLKNGTYQSYQPKKDERLLKLIVSITVVALFLVILLAVGLKFLKKSKIVVKTQIVEPSLKKTAEELFGSSCDIIFSELLGSGSYGRVYRAKFYNEDVAIKITIPFRKSFDEGILAQDLDHPNIVRTINYSVLAKREIMIADNLKSSQSDKSNGKKPPGISSSRLVKFDRSDSVKIDNSGISSLELWIIQEFCNLGNLSRSLDSSYFRNNDDNQVKMYNILLSLQDIAQGLSYLHDKSIIHSDLNCNNILLKSKTVTDFDTRDFFAKVCDFGMITFFSDWSGSYKTVEVKGTITHMAPEMILKGHQSPSCDIYAFGIMMWELYMGETVFQNIPRGRIVDFVLVQKLRPTFLDNCPIRYSNLAQMCWSDDRSDRPTWITIMEELDGLIRENRELERSHFDQPMPRKSTAERPLPSINEI